MNKEDIRMNFFKRNGKKIMITVIVLICILFASHITVNYLVPYIAELHK